MSTPHNEPPAVRKLTEREALLFGYCEHNELRINASGVFLSEHERQLEGLYIMGAKKQATAEIPPQGLQ